MADTGWLTPLAGSVTEFYVDAPFVNMPRITDLTPSQFCSSYIQNVGVQGGSFAVYGQNTGALYMSFPNVVGSYPSNAVVDRIEFKLTADYTTGDKLAHGLHVYMRDIYIGGVGNGSYYATASDEQPVADRYLNFSTTANPDYGPDDKIYPDSEVPGLGKGMLVNDLLNKRGADSKSNGFQFMWIRFQCKDGDTRPFTAQLRIGSIQMRVHYTVASNQIDLSANVPVSVTTTQGKLSHLKDIGEANVLIDVSPNAGIALNANYNMAANLLVELITYATMSSQYFIDNDCKVFIDVSISADLMRLGDMSANVPVQIAVADAPEIWFIRDLYADAAIDVSLWDFVILGIQQDMESAGLIEIVIDAQAPDGTVAMSANVPVNVSLSGNAAGGGIDIGYVWALAADVSFGITISADAMALVKDQLIASDGFISVMPSADTEIAHLINLYSSILIDVTGTAYMTFGPTQSDSLTERRMVIEPGERTMVISPSDRTLTISTN